MPYDLEYLLMAAQVIWTRNAVDGTKGLALLGAAHISG